MRNLYGIIPADMFILYQNKETSRLTLMYEALYEHQSKVCCIKTHVGCSEDNKQQEDKAHYRKKKKKKEIIPICKNLSIIAAHIQIVFFINMFKDMLEKGCGENSDVTSGCFAQA